MMDSSGFTKGMKATKKELALSRRLMRSMQTPMEKMQIKLAKAAELYKNALSAAQHKNEQASAINGSARVLAKRGFYSRSIRNYKILVENYSPVIDGTGYPFSYYALHQLIVSLICGNY